jgi:hypothetical protein
MDTTSAFEASSGRAAGTDVATLTLDHLIDLDAAMLESLYRTARVPRLADVNGDLQGRMLAVPSLGASLPSWLRAFVRSSAFPWRGKSFTPHGAERGEGINRVLGDRFRWFRFTTFVGRSRAGEFEAVQLDYDHADNPFFIRAIEDEIRELRPGLWLGQAYLRVRGQSRLALWFALAQRS